MEGHERSSHVYTTCTSCPIIEIVASWPAAARVEVTRLVREGGSRVERAKASPPRADEVP